LAAAIIAGAFYGVDVSSSLWLIALLVLVAFVAGAAFRVWRRKTHDRAFDAEYSSRSAIPAPPGDERVPDFTVSAGIPHSSMPAAATVTFNSAFMLPGLDRPHAAGTFELRERRDALDVSFDAAIVTRTIILTGGGLTEALDVKADDLAAALKLDSSG
jgi:hypothetical protein